MNPHADVLLSETLLMTRENARTESAVNEAFNYSEFGQRHGGSNKLHALTNAVSAVTVGAIALVLLTMLPMHLSVATATVIVVSLAFTALGLNLALCALYLRPHRFINLLLRCAILLMIPVGMPAIFLLIYYLS